MNIRQVPLKDKHWIPQVTEKKYIIIHGTNSRTKFSPQSGKKGGAQDIVDRWNNNKEKFASPYLIDRDGTIVQTFPDEHWAYHLNISNSYGNYDRMSVGIELVNELGLLKENNIYYMGDYVHHQNIYTGPKFEKQFRRYNYWADLSKEQVDSLVNLIDFLTTKHNIEPIFYNSIPFDKKAWDKGTIFTHSMINQNVNDLPLNQWVSDKLQNRYFKLIKSSSHQLVEV